MRLRNKDFTIISNNCWGGTVYEDLAQPYTTPTVGLYFFASCYLKFLKRLEHYASAPMTFRDVSTYERANEQREGRRYPIGALDDIEVHFLHYETEDEAREKWTRRAARINFANLFVAYSDVDLCTADHMREFERLAFPHKVFFGAKNYAEMRSLVWLKCYEKDAHVGDISVQRWSYRKYFDVVAWLNAQ
jgi:uncharacterized protein (DUF1919 family)